MDPTFTHRLQLQVRKNRYILGAIVNRRYLVLVVMVFVL